MNKAVLCAIALGTFLIVAHSARAGVAADALCREAKAKAAGKKAFDLMKAFGKNLKKPDASKLGAAISKAQSKFTKGFDKAEAKGGCATSDDSDAIEAKVDTLVVDVVANVAISCGDNVRAGDEECDGTDDSACVCPGTCRPPGHVNACTCPPLECGNNCVDEGGEQCDGTDDSSCPGICQANCRCPQPVCGNGVLEVGEECEAPCSEDPPCGGGTICGVTCQCEPAVPCDCGTPPPTTLSFTSMIEGGVCGELTDGNETTLLDLQCSDTYVGCGVTGSAPVATPIPMGTSLYKVECCYGTKLALTSYGPGDTGSDRTCTEAGCFIGAPIPVLAEPLILSPCTWQLITRGAFGSADCSTGEVAIDYALEAPVFLTGDQLPKRCSGGSDPGGLCTDDSDCPGGTCLGDPTFQPCPLCNPTTLTCNGGPNDGLACTPGTVEISPQYPTSHDCPPHALLEIGVQLQHPSLRTGTESAHTPDGQFCGYCRDVNIEGSSCYDGDPDNDLTPGQKACPDSAVIPDCQPASYHSGEGGSIDGCGPSEAIRCDSDADCYAPYETCEQRVPGAFQFAGGKNMTNWGSPAGDLSDRLEHSITLASLHCSPVSFSEQVDQNACFPGPAATSMPGTIQLLP